MALQFYSRTILAFKYWLARRLPTCKDMSVLTSASLERKLLWRERVHVKLHFWICAACLRYLNHLHLMRDRLREADSHTLHQQDPQPTLSEDARRRIKRALRGVE